jgi:uncharacterized protein YggU (UPF0235/DUF167 family)
MVAINNSPSGMTFAVKVHPRAKKNAITGEVGDALKVALTAPPVEGQRSLHRIFRKAFEGTAFLRYYCSRPD